MARQKKLKKVNLDKKEDKIIEELEIIEKPIEISIEEPEEEIKKYKVKIESTDIRHGKKPAFISKIGGYDKRIYFDLTFKELEYLKDNKNAYIGKMLTIYYIGDITNAFKVKILPVKSLEYIGA